MASIIRALLGRRAPLDPFFPEGFADTLRNHDHAGRGRWPVGAEQPDERGNGAPSGHPAGHTQGGGGKTKREWKSKNMQCKHANVFHSYTLLHCPTECVTGLRPKISSYPFLNPNGCGWWQDRNTLPTDPSFPGQGFPIERGGGKRVCGKETRSNTPFPTC